VLAQDTNSVARSTWIVLGKPTSRNLPSRAWRHARAWPQCGMQRGERTSKIWGNTTGCELYGPHLYSTMLSLGCSNQLA
jgi:hypothetical protein